MGYKFVITTPEEESRAVEAMMSGALDEDSVSSIAEAVRNFREGVDLSPYKVKNDVYTSGMPAPVTPGAPKTDLYGPDLRNAADFGVDVDQSTPAEVSFGAELADPKEKADWYTKSLTKALGYKVKVRESPYIEGRYEYLKKQKDGKSRWTLIQKGAAGLGTDLALAAPELIGTLGGGLIGAAGGAPGMIAGQALGGGLGAAAGEYARSKLGSFVGASAPDDTLSLGKDMGKAAGKSALFSLATDATFGAFKFGRYWFKGFSPLRKWEALELLKNADEGSKLAAELNKYANPDNPLRMTIPQMAVNRRVSPSGIDEYTLTAQGKRTLGVQARVENDPWIGAKLQEWNNTAQDSLMDIYDNIATEARSGLPASTSAFEAGTPALDAARNAYNDAQFLATQNVAEQEKLARDYFEKAFPDAPPQQLANEVRQAISKSEDWWKEQEDELWKQWDSWFKDKDGSYKPMFVPVDDELARYLRSDQGAKAYGFFKKSPILNQSNLYGGAAGLGKRTPLNEADALEQVGPFKPLRTQFLDLGALTNDIKGIRATLRKAIDQGQITFAQAKELETQLKSFRQRAIDGIIERNPDMYMLDKDLSLAEGWSKLRADRFDQGLADRFTKATRDTWKVQDQTALAQMLAVKDTASYDHFVRIINESPEAKQKLKETFLGLYLSKYTKDGLPTTALNQKFWVDHGWAIRKLWGEKEALNINTLDLLARNIEASRKDLANFKDIFVQRYGTLFGGKSPMDVKAEDLVNGIWTGAVKGEDLRSFINFVKTQDRHFGTESLAIYKDGVLDSLRNKITKNGKLDFRAMENIIEERRDALDTLFGADFTKNFNKVMQASRAVNATVPQQAQSTAYESKVVEHIMRTTWAAPLTKEGRLLTFGSFLRGSNYKKTVGQIFTDPEVLRKLASLSDKMLTYNTWVNVFSKALADTRDK